MNSEKGFVMKTIEFKYNKYAPGILLMLIFFGLVLVGFGIFMLLNNYMGLNDPILPPFFQKHSIMILVIGILPCFIWFVLAIFPACRIWLKYTQKQGKFDFHENDADLFFNNTRLRIERGSFWIETKAINFGGGGHSPMFPNLKKYCITIGEEKRWLIESYTEGFEKTTFMQRLRGYHPETSLVLAMQELSFLFLPEKGEKFNIKEVEIIFGTTTSAVFDDTPYYIEYYVEYAMEQPSITPFISCWVREKADPDHVVGCLGIEDNPKHPEQLTEEALRTRSIVDGFEADERIAADG